MCSYAQQKTHTKQGWKTGDKVEKLWKSQYLSYGRNYYKKTRVNNYQKKNKVGQSIYEKMFNFRKNQSNANKNEIIFLIY